MGKYVPQMKFLDVLLGDEPVLAPYERFYQRLLANDVEEATELAEGLLATESLEQVYDDVLIPALAMAERDAHDAELTPDRQARVYAAISELAEDLRDTFVLAQAARHEAEEEHRSARQEAKAVVAVTTKAAAAATKVVTAAANSAAAAAAPPSAAVPSEDAEEKRQRPALPKGCTVNVLCLPAHDEADAITAQMLSYLLEVQGYCAVAMGADALAGEMVQAVRDRNADVVCVAALPPGAVTHCRYLCKRLHRVDANIRMLAGLWTFKGDLKNVKTRLACAGNVELATSLSQAMDEIEQLAQPAILRGDGSAPRPDAPPSRGTTTDRQWRPEEPAPPATVRKDERV
jgi:methanogenic corrinoid protein MtbC1